MADIMKAWNAGFVERWHTHPSLAGSGDRNSGHQHRCAVLLLLLWPDSTRDAIIDVLIHDQGEIDAGDMAHPAKVKHPELRAMLHDVEEQSISEQGFVFGDLSWEQLERRAFVDLLDSYLWAIRHREELRFRAEWQAQREKLDRDAKRLGVEELYVQLLADFFALYT